MFSNVGIAETYLKSIGFDVVLANELIKKRADFYTHMYKNKMICGDITNKDIYNDIINRSKELGVNFIIATPPCQGMSSAGKRDSNDIRNLLITKVVDVIKDLLPDFILIENVPQMLKTEIRIGNKKYLIKDYINDQLNGLGYKIKFDIFDAADYGTPQHRKRLFVRIYKNFYKWEDPIKQKHITVRDSIGDLPTLEAGEKSKIKYHYVMPHNKNHILWMKHTPTGFSAFSNEVYYPQKDGRKIKAFKTAYKRIEWDKPSPTITMSNGNISSDNNVHPGRLMKNGLYSDARVMSLLEIYRLTGLPDNWSPPVWASDNLIRQVIGEGVPPKLIKNIFKGLVENSSII